LIIFKLFNYRFYCDNIRINTETGNFLIPVYAYPVLDREELREVLPKLMDFGRVEIGESNLIVKKIIYIK
jgi:hypothetical protein